MNFTPMKTSHAFQIAVSALALTSLSCGLVARAKDQIPKGFNTPIPQDILTPDKVKTRIGDLNYFDGLPDDQTIERARYQVDLGRGVRAFLNFIPAASMEMMYVGHRDDYGIKSSNQVGLFENLMSSDSLWLTGNTDTVYASTFLDLNNGPIVIEVPPGMGPGTVNDAYFRFVVDMG